MKQGIPAHVWAVITLLQAHNHRAYLVGGCVRDLLQGVAPHDWDVATTALPGRVAEIFPRVLPTGVALGTVTVISGGEKIEVTTLRQDGVYRDGRRPSQVTFGQDLVADLLRRDFTINAIAYDPSGDRVVDPTGGRADLRAGIVRAVGDPRQRFAEDALRMLRAVRFAGQMGAKIEPQTWRALCSLHSGLRRIASERIRWELDKIMLQEPVLPALNLLHESGLLAVIFPSLYSPRHRHLQAVNFLTCALLPPILHLRLAGLVGGLGETAALLAARHYSKDFSRRVAHLLAHTERLAETSPAPASLRYFLSTLQPGNLSDLQLLVTAAAAAGWWGPRGDGIRELVDELQRVAATDFPLSPQQLAIDGHVLLQHLHIEPGPLVGEILRQLWLETLADPRRNRASYLLPRARQLARGKRAQGA